MDDRRDGGDPHVGDDGSRRGGGGRTGGDGGQRRGRDPPGGDEHTHGANGRGGSGGARGGGEPVENPLVAFVRDVLVSVAIVGGIAVVLFGVSGIWPPMVAVESGSMAPNLQKGDLVFVVNETRFVPDGVEARHGVVPRDVAADAGYQRFGEPGDVIVFAPDGNRRRRAVIHRAIRWVEDGETWVDANGDEHEAHHAGFLTKGDNNPNFDQADGISGPVRPSWIRGKAKYSVPAVGNIRLLFPFATGPGR